VSAPAKELLKISELAERADVPVATVRHYLREGLLPEPVKTSRNMAYYPPEFADRIRLIKQLQEERFMPLRVIREVLLAERTSRADVLARFDLPERALDRLAEVGVLDPDERGYSPADVRVLEAIAKFRAEGWNETTGFGARDVARLKKGLEPVVADELELMVERFEALDPQRAAELLEGGLSPFPELIGALHAKVLADELERRRS
jgi:DNA-binding transcriptional MerR regulator